ncbi:MAG: hypothetical protein MJZ50_04280 [Treponema sp.]|nr:hypothetical protein [Treponema sp.]
MAAEYHKSALGFCLYQKEKNKAIGFVRILDKFDSLKGNFRDAQNSSLPVIHFK